MLVKTINLFLFFLLLLGCTANETNDIYNGKITVFDDFPSVENIVGEKIELEDIYTGWFSVYDSLMLFEAYSHPDGFFYLFNLNTGKRVFSFAKKDIFPFFYSPATDYQYEMKDNMVYLWTRDVDLQKLYLVNLTKSVLENKLIVNEEKNIKIWSDKKGYRILSFVFILDENHCLAKNQPQIITQFPLNYKQAYYSILNEEDSTIREYTLYSRPLINKVSTMPFEMYFCSYDAIHPNKKKVAMTYALLSQVDVLDLETGKLTGLRKKDTPDFHDLETKDSGFVFYYGDISVDDTYIYATYINSLYEEFDSFSSNEIHVFDWDGNPVTKIITDQKFSLSSLDSVNKKLYMKNDEEDIFIYDVQFLYP